MAALGTTRISLLAVAAALALAGCTSQTGNANDQSGDNEASVADNPRIDTNDAALAPEDLSLPAGDSAVVEDAATAPAIRVVEVPAPAPSVSAADAAPLNDAVAVEQLIDSGSGITRVQQGDGWAWMQNGQVIRTASRDGHQVSYFHRGSTEPYFVQQDGRSYSYSNGRVSKEYDERGTPQVPNAQRQSEARQLAQQAQQHHDRAQQASKTAPHVDRSDEGRAMADESPSRNSPTKETGSSGTGRDGPTTRTSGHGAGTRDAGSSQRPTLDHRVSGSGASTGRSVAASHGSDGSDRAGGRSHFNNSSDERPSNQDSVTR